jgi:hypothetical protein
MAYADWKIKAKRLVSCNCDLGCPCEFMGLPTHGHCQGIEALEIVEGHFEDVRLDGLRVAGVYRWPGPVHEGKGVYLPVVDPRASEEQQEALFKILGGEEQEPTTIFNIYGSTIETELDPVFTDITFEWDIETRHGRMAVEGVMDGTMEPIRNPVTGEEFRALIRLPGGFEFRDAEMVSSSFKTEGPLEMNEAGRYGAIFLVTYGPHGIVEEESYPNVAA